MHSERRGVSQSVEMGLTQMDRLVQEMTDVINALSISNQVNAILSSPEAIPSYNWFAEYKAFENLLATVAAKGSHALNVTVISQSGKVYYTGAQYNSLLNLNEPLLTHMIDRKGAVSLINRALTRVDQNEVLTCGKAFFQRGNLLGVALVDVPLSSIADMMSGMEKGGIQLYVLNREGDIIYANKDNSGLAAADTLKAVLAEGRQSLAIGEADYMVIPAQSGRTGLSILAMVPIANVFSESNRLFVQMLFIFVSIVLLATAVLVGISKGISKGLARLNRAVSTFGETGSEIVLVPRTTDEVGELTEGTVAMSRRIVRLLAQIREDEHTKWQLEFSALQSQINPHMIYNTLNTITYLAQLQNVSNIENISSSFVLLLRMISNRSGEYISIREEIACVEAYVAIKRYSLPWDIECIVDVEGKAQNMRILKLLMQPFVENAIVHGFSGSIISGKLTISVTIRDGNLEMHIADNGSGIDDETLQKILSGPVKSNAAFSNVGVYNTLRRLQLTYANQVFFSIQSEVAKGTDVFIRFPAVEMAE